jgi:SAM-dependent methyltransferase
LCELRTGLRVDWWDGITLPYEDDSFDWVISFSVLLHVPPSDIARHVSEMLRVARRYLFVSTYTGSGDGLAAHCFAHDYALFDGLCEVEYRHFSEEDNTQWLIAA